MEFEIIKEEFEIEEQQNYNSIIQTLFKALFSHLSNSDKTAVDKAFNEQIKEPFRVAVIGQSGVGKSSTLNHLFGLTLPVSDIEEGTTEVIEKVFKMPSGLDLSIFDMPGLLQSRKKDAQYVKMYQKILPKCDVILYIMRANARNIGDDCDIIKNSILPICQANKIQKNFIIGINKVDIIGESEGSDWDRTNNCPTPRLVELMRTRVADICTKFVDEGILLAKEVDPDQKAVPLEQIVFFSALRNFQLDKLLMAVTNAGERGWIWTGLDGYNQFMKGTKN